MKNVIVRSKVCQREKNPGKCRSTFLIENLILSIFHDYKNLDRTTSRDDIFDSSQGRGVFRRIISDPTKKIAFFVELKRNLIK